MTSLKFQAEARSDITYMANPIKFDESGDSADLQSLFDSIASDAAPPVPPKPVAAPSSSGLTESGDSPDLQALFDTVAAQVEEPAPASSSGAEQPGGEAGSSVFNHLGQMTRALHDTLHELGYDAVLQDAASGMPDTRQRLTYIAQMTEKAASRVLNATEIAKPIQEALEKDSSKLATRWEGVFSNQLSVNDFKILASDTHAFLKDVTAKSNATNAQLLEIIMAQDFQDLTGQVIKKITELAQKMEAQLLQVLIEAKPPEIQIDEGLLNGPVMNAQGRSDVVTTQEQVDDLLESLGF